MCSGDGCLQWAIKSLLFIWRFSRVLSYSIPTSRNWWDLERTITRSDDGKNLELSFCCRFSQWNWQINAELCREDAYTRNSVDCGTNFPDISTVAFSASFMLNFLFFFSSYHGSVDPTASIRSHIRSQCRSQLPSNDFLHCQTGLMADEHLSSIKIILGTGLKYLEVKTG